MAPRDQPIAWRLPGLRMRAERKRKREGMKRGGDREGWRGDSEEIVMEVILVKLKSTSRVLGEILQPLLQCLANAKL